MNVEIGAEAAQFPEKEYIKELPLQCSSFKINGVVNDNNNLFSIAFVVMIIVSFVAE
jgi:hypothetical protein